VTLISNAIIARFLRTEAQRSVSSKEKRRNCISDVFVLLNDTAGGNEPRKDRRFVRNVDNSRYRSSHRMQFYKPFRLRGPLVALHCLSNALLSLRPQTTQTPSVLPRFINFTSPPSLSLSLSLRLPLARALTQFCNFNLIFAHRYRPVQTAIMRADLIRHRCLSASAYFFRPL